jgi:YhhN family
VLFAASDIAVARERFVQQGFLNQLWGWPTYFVAQLVLAWTVAKCAGVT